MHPRPYGLYRSEADFGNCAKKGILSPVLKYIEFILKSLDFSQGFQIQLQFLHSGIQTEKCSQNLSDTQKGIHVHTLKSQNFILQLLLKSVTVYDRQNSEFTL
jgi:hypothetical protein